MAEDDPDDLSEICDYCGSDGGCGPECPGFDLDDEAEPRCPKCGGEVGCNSDGTWKCIQGTGRHIGCGWCGVEPD
jgi:hypothetical protein